MLHLVNLSHIEIIPQVGQMTTASGSIHVLSPLALLRNLSAALLWQSKTFYQFQVIFVIRIPLHIRVLLLPVISSMNYPFVYTPFLTLLGVMLACRHSMKAFYTASFIKWRSYVTIRRKEFFGFIWRRDLYEMAPNKCPMYVCMYKGSRV